MTAIDIKGLSKTYKSPTGKKKPALNNLHLKVEQGEIYGFIGPNGAGKSTTIKMLFDLIRPTSGEATIFNIPVSNPECRKRVGYLPENPVYYDFLTPCEMLSFAGNIYKMDKKIMSKRIEELLHTVDLYDVRNTQLRRFSKGMVQRAGIARTLVSDPDLFIFDEPTSGLDPLGRKLVVDIMIGLKKAGKTIFFSSHILHDVETISDRVGIIVDGCMVKEEKISSLLMKSIEVVEVTANINNLETLRELENKGFSCRIEGDMLKILSKEANLWTLLDYLKTKEIPLYSVEPKRKTMEDTFLELVANKEK